MHTDESVNAYLIGQQLAGKPFAYDPRDRHGPGLFALAEPVVKICGAKNFSDLTESELRLTPVVIGSATILMFGAAVELFGFLPCLIGALLFTISPLPVYYSRYFIQETPFVAATFGLMICSCQMWKKKSIWFATLAGLCAAWMLGCKETAVIHFFSLGAAFLCVWRISHHGQMPSNGLAQPNGNPLPADKNIIVSRGKVLLTSLAVFIVALILLFSWFGRNWGALGEMFRAVPNFAARAGGQGHEKPFAYYFGIMHPLLVPFIAAMAGIYAAIHDAVTGVRRASFMLVIYSVVTLLIYSFIPYKTPWLALNLWLPIVLLCGLGIEAGWLRLKGSTARCVVVIAVAALCVMSGKETKSLVFDHPADEQNPLAYAHTVDDLLRLPPVLKLLADENQLSQPVIAVVAADPWPLPWYLRHYSRVGFWQPGQDPGPADFYITSLEAANDIESHLKDRLPEFFGLRPEVLVVLWPPATPSTNAPIKKCIDY